MLALLSIPRFANCANLFFSPKHLNSIWGIIIGVSENSILSYVTIKTKIKVTTVPNKVHIDEFKVSMQVKITKKELMN